MHTLKRFEKTWLFGLFIFTWCLVEVASACTRVVYLGADNQVITARSMDWKLDVGTNLWVLPRGAKRHGQAGPNSLEWTAKYGSVVATGYDRSEEHTSAPVTVRSPMPPSA